MNQKRVEITISAKSVDEFARLQQAAERLIERIVDVREKRALTFHVYRSQSLIVGVDIREPGFSFGRPDVGLEISDVTFVSTLPKSEDGWVRNFGLKIDDIEYRIRLSN